MTEIWKKRKSKARKDVKKYSRIININVHEAVKPLIFLLYSPEWLLINDHSGIAS